MQFGKNIKLSPQLIVPFEVFDDVGQVVYRLALLPSFLGVHLVLNVLILKIYHWDMDQIITWDLVLLDNDLTYEKETVVIRDQDFCKLMKKKILLVKVQRKHHPVNEANLETQKDRWDKYPQFLVDKNILFFLTWLIFPC